MSDTAPVDPGAGAPAAPAPCVVQDMTVMYVFVFSSRGLTLSIDHIQCWTLCAIALLL